MRSMLRLLVVGAFALLIFIPAFAQTPEVSTLPVTEPLQVGSTILQPGVYTIRVLPDLTSREKIQITSPDMKKVFATVLTVPHQFKPGEDTKNTTFVYFPAGEGMPAALRTWYAPHPEASMGGHDIVYEESRAKQLARLSNSSVVAYEGETADINSAPLAVVTPQATVETYTTPAPETPAMTSATTATTTPLVTETPAPAPAPEPQVAESSPEMPRTASNVPLMALLGLASIGAAAAFRFGRTE